MKELKEDINFKDQIEFGLVKDRNKLPDSMKNAKGVVTTIDGKSTDVKSKEFLEFASAIRKAFPDSETQFKQAYQEYDSTFPDFDINVKEKKIELRSETGTVTWDKSFDELRLESPSTYNLLTRVLSLKD